MGLKSLIQKNVKKAFDRIGDAAVIVTLVKKNTTGFNFSTITATESAATTFSLRGILLEKKKNTSDTGSNTSRLAVLLVAEEMGEFSEFDTLTIDGVSYTPERPFTSNGYTVEIMISRSQ